MGAQAGAGLYIVGKGGAPTRISLLAVSQVPDQGGVRVGAGRMSRGAV
jgi:hypothetical protein